MVAGGVTMVVAVGDGVPACAASCPAGVRQATGATRRPTSSKVRQRLFVIVTSRGAHAAPEMGYSIVPGKGGGMGLLAEGRAKTSGAEGQATGSG
jgi:hypothetical protein